MKVYYQAPMDDQYNERYNGVGAGTLSDKERAQIRNVQVEQRKQASGKTIDSSFRDEYAKKGLQPTYLGNQEDDAERKKYQAIKQIDRTARIEYEAALAAEEAASVNIIETGDYTVERKIRGGKRVKLPSPSLFKRSRAVAVTMGIWGWGFWTYFWFQLPFAIFSVIFMAITMAIYELFQWIEPAEDDGFLTAALKWGGRVLKAVGDSLRELIISFVKQIFGLDLSLFNPGGFFLLTLMIAMIIGWTTLAIAATVYTVGRIHSLNGDEGGGIKMAFFLLAMIGYSIPVFNLFPWFFLWTLAVMKYPK